MQRSKIILVLLAIFSLSNSAGAEKIAIDRPDPYYPSDQAFYDQDAKKHFLDEFEGRTILLVFWATWCGACVDEMAGLEILAKDFRKLAFNVVPVSQDFQGMEVIEKFYQEREYRHLPIYHDYRNALFSDMNVVSIPTAFLINTNNQVVAVFRGGIKWHEEEVRKIILDIIPGNHPTPKNTYKKPAVNYNISKKVERSANLKHNKTGEDGTNNINNKTNQ